MQDSNYPQYPPPPPPPYQPVNPYAAPTAAYSAGPAGSLADAERIRHELLKHEAGIKSIGALYFFGAVVFLLATIGFGVAMLVGAESAPEGGAIVAFFMVALFGLLAVLYYWLGKGLRQLDPKVRTAAIVMACIGLLGFPLGTLINAYFLYLLASEKGARVLSPEYQQIVAMTPHIRYKSPWLLVLVIIILVLVAIFAIASLSN